MKVISAATNIGQAFKNAGRVREIVGIFFQHGFADLLHRMQLHRFLPSKTAENALFKDQPLAERLRRSFEALGPTFVKLGQLLASRPDIIPENFIEEFEKLQDNVVQLSFTEIEKFLQQELKRPIEQVFSYLDREPIAAASIAQVHRATLQNGKKIAVKIQRPGIVKLIQNDISILRGLASLLEKYVPEVRPFNPTGLVEEFFRSILFETDFLIEANNIRKISNNLKHFDKIVIPQVFAEHSTSRVLVLEHFEGIRFSDREGILKAGMNPTEIVTLGSEVFFHMVMHDGIFHGDLHPGNLFVLPDNKIGIIDFGIVGRLSKRAQDSIIVMFTAIVEEDYETLAYEYINACQPRGHSDITLLQKDLMDLISPYVGMTLGQINIGQLLLRSTVVASRHQLQVPRELMLLFKAMVTIEGMGKRMDPDFDLMETGTRLARQLITTRYSRERILRDLLIIGRDFKGLIETSPRQIRQFLRVWSHNNFVFETQNKDMGRMVEATRQLAQVFTLSSLALGLYAIGIACLILNREPFFLGYPVSSILSFLFATMLLSHRMWKLRKSK